MKTIDKIDLVRSVLDELIFIEGCTTTEKKQALQVVNEVLKPLKLCPSHCLPVDVTIQEMHDLAQKQAINLNDKLNGLLSLSESALTQLHDIYFNELS